MDGVSLCAGDGGREGERALMAMLWKAIKPNRLKDDVMRLALLNAVRKAGTGIKQDFQRTTATWEHKPKFETLVSLSGGPTVLVDTNDQVYAYINNGTKPHIIRPVKAKALRFSGTFTAKTVPGVLDARPGGSSGDPVFSMVVHHPGTKARNFDSMIAKKWRTPFKQRMQDAMRDAARASGHAIR